MPLSPLKLCSLRMAIHLGQLYQANHFHRTPDYRWPPAWLHINQISLTHLQTIADIELVITTDLIEGVCAAARSAFTHPSMAGCTTFACRSLSLTPFSN